MPIKPTTIAAVALVLTFNNTFAADDTPGDEAKETPDTEVEITPDEKDGQVNVPSNEAMDFCFFAGGPPLEAKYTVIRRLKVAKGTYGGVKEILPRLARDAQRAGADAIINYAGSQRFGFWPWRMVRPVVGGVAIKWTDPKNRNCTAIGGTTLQTILTSDEAPLQ